MRSAAPQIKASMKRRTLPFDKANAICRKLLAIGDAIWIFAEQLRAEGYGAFAAYNDFVESFGASDEIAVHRLCAVEQAKVRLGQPWPMKYTADERKLLYSSTLLDELSAKRDSENGCAPSALTMMYPGVESLWRREIDPCRRNMVRIEVSDKPQYQSRFTEFFERQSRMLESEIRTHLLEDTDHATFEMEDRFARLHKVMSEVAAPLGFRYNMQRSRAEFPVYSKQITNGWDLC